MKYRIIIEQDEEGRYVVQCPSLPGCISEGDNFEDALKNIGEAAELYLEDVKMDKALEQFAKEAQEIIVAPIKVAV